MTFGKRLSRLTTAFRANDPQDVAGALKHVSRMERMGLATRMPDMASYKQIARQAAKTNAVVAACIQWHLGTFPQGTLTVTDEEGNAVARTRDGRKTKGPRLFTPAARLQQLLDKPNPVMSQSQLRRICGLYQLLSGNAYLWKQRAKDGSVIALWPFHGGQFLPVPGDDVDTWISHYRYSPGDGTAINIAPSEVIQCQWPFLPDPENIMIGMSPVMGVARDVAIDNEASRYVWAYLANDAVVSTVWTFPDTLMGDELEKMKSEIVRKFSSNSRGKPAIVSEGVKVEKLGSNMKELQSTTLHAVSEVRICMMMRVRPMLAGVNAGIENGREGNYESERRVQTEDTLVPWWDQFVDDLDCGLTEELPGGIEADFDGGLMITLDTSNVKALQEDASLVLDRGSKQSVSIKELQIMFYDGKLPRDAAIANARKFFPDLDDAALDELFKPVDPNDKTPPPNELRTTVGGANALMLLPAQVKEGKTTLEAARAMAVVTFGYTEAEAKQILPDDLAPDEPESAPKDPTPVVPIDDSTATNTPPIEGDNE